MSEAQLAIGFGDVLAAAEVLRGVALRTPVFTSRTVDQMTGGSVYFKAENLQRGGSFKFRGAYNKLHSLSPEQRTRGVVAFSSGNHAQGVALAARELGIPAVIVMPSDAPPIKVEATAGYGAEVVLYDRLTEDREAIAARLSAERGLTVVPPYDDPAVMAGQGTAMLELAEQVGDPLDLVLTPVGGSGLISGTATAAKGLNPSTQIIRVEPELGNDTQQSLRRGERVTIPPSNTIADGIRTQAPGRLTFPIVQQLVEDVLTVSEAEIEAAVRFMLLRLKLLVEPTGAVPVALLLSGRLDVRSRRVGVIISGGNCDPAVLCDILGRT